MFCEGCAQERTRNLFAVRSVIRELWGDEGVAKFDLTLRARRTEGRRRGAQGRRTA
jgi:hypothetical protein